MDDEIAFPELGECQRVESILQDGLVVESNNLYSAFLWRAKWHASTCDLCQQRHPGVLASLATMITNAETALVLEIDEIRGEHMREASEIARRSILSRPAESIFPLDKVLLTEPSCSVEERSSGEEDTALLLMRSLAKAGRRVKGVFAAVHGEGLVWFNVVPDLNDDEQEFARKECAGLVRQLSRESREFAFSAALATELFPNLAPAWSLEPPLGVHLGVLYKVVQAAAAGYIEAYFHSLDNPTLQPWDLGAQRQSGMTDLLRNEFPKHESNTETVESVYKAQTVMMDVQSGLMERMQRLEEEWREARNAPDTIDAECEAVLQRALGSRFSQLSDETRGFLVSAERNYSHPQSDSDFTAAVFFLTKAFEFEFRRRVIEPLINDLEPLAMTDKTFREELTKFTLGKYLALFSKYPLRTEPLIERLGLQYRTVCTAISRANKEKDVKHLASKTKAEATDFRAAFLGRESVLNAPFPTPVTLISRLPSPNPVSSLNSDRSPFSPKPTAHKKPPLPLAVEKVYSGTKGDLP